MLPDEPFRAGLASKRPRFEHVELLGFIDLKARVRIAWHRPSDFATLQTGARACESYLQIDR